MDPTTRFDTHVLKRVSIITPLKGVKSLTTQVAIVVVHKMPFIYDGRLQSLVILFTRRLTSLLQIYEYPLLFVPKSIVKTTWVGLRRKRVNYWRYNYRNTPGVYYYQYFAFNQYHASKANKESKHYTFPPISYLSTPRSYNHLTKNNLRQHSTQNS